MASSPTRLDLDPDRVAHCDSYKVGFGSHEDAWTAAEVMMEQGLVYPGCHITPYHCERCGEWHVYNRRIVAV